MLDSELFKFELELQVRDSESLDSQHSRHEPSDWQTWTRNLTRDYAEQPGRDAAEAQRLRLSWL